MKTKFTETQMEKYLQNLGYNIMDSDGDDSVIDSIKACDIVTGKQIGRASCRERVSSPV